MTYDNWKTTEPDPFADEPDFCLIHGYEHMTRQHGNPIPYCTACEREHTSDDGTKL